MGNKLILTGIKPTGSLHLGNYFGVIKPLINLMKIEENTDFYIFIADGHALVNQLEAGILKKNTEEMMLDLFSIFSNVSNNNNHVYLYRQSKIPATFELYWILSCLCAKGLLNRNHSYKQQTDINIGRNNDPDKGVFMGLFNYPVLMAADIMLFNPDYVPVGKDQKQHLEITNELINKFNFVYSDKNCDIFKPVMDIIDVNQYVLPGTDGRKMSKSYDNTVPVFGSIMELKKYVAKIKTNSKQEGDPKFFPDSEIFEIWKRLGLRNSDYPSLLVKASDGASWKELKSMVCDKLIDEFDNYKNTKENFSIDFDYVLRYYQDNEYIINHHAGTRMIKIKQKIGV